MQTNQYLDFSGWDYATEDIKDYVARGNMHAFLTETSNVCDQNCFYCYTVPDERKLCSKPHTNPLPGELTLEQRLALIDQASVLGARTYEIVGAGEPFIDPLLFEQLRYAHVKNMIPVVFTNGYLLGTSEESDKWLKLLDEYGVTVVVKWHGPEAVHDRMVQKRGSAKARDAALQKLVKAGFAKEGSGTRIALDNILCKPTAPYAEECLRLARENHFGLVFSTYIPQGLTVSGGKAELDAQEIRAVYEKLQTLDKQEFDIDREISMPYITGAKCRQYWGLYVTIDGRVHGCPGQSESYGKLYTQDGKIRLEQIWRERKNTLEGFEGGCPPRLKYHEEKGVPILENLFERDREHRLEQEARKGSKFR